MLQAVWFDAGAQRPGRLLLTIHHLAVDGVSWRILVPDLAAAWEAIAARRVRLALGRAAPRCGGGRNGLRRRRQNAGRVRELAFWSRDAERNRPLCWLMVRLMRIATLPARHGQLTLTLPAAMTGALLTRVPAAFHAGINDVLLTGLVVAVAQWCRRRGRSGEQCGADRCGGSWARGDFPRR